MVEHMEVDIAAERYAKASAEFKSAAAAENRILNGEFSFSFEPPFLQPNYGDFSPLEEARRKTAEKLNSFNRAAAIYRNSQ